jgi:transketolase
MRKTSLDMVLELARKDPRVVFIGSDLGAGTLKEFQDEFPDRFFMEGVAEQNLVGMAAGLAKDGFIPYINTIATFLTRRCFEQVAVDLCLHNLPVRLIANGGGLVYAPLGPTHIAIDDIALMRTLPNMTVVAPSDAPEMRRFVPETLNWPGPVYIRLGKGGDPVISQKDDPFTIGKAKVYRDKGDVLICGSGIMTERGIKAADLLAQRGISCQVVHFHTIKPLDEETLFARARNARLIVTLDEHLLAGGLGSAVAEAMTDRYTSRIPAIRRLGLNDRFTDDYGSQDSLLASLGLDAAGIAETIAGALGNLKAA